MHGLLFGLLVLQLLLAWFGFEAPIIGFFHPVNALAHLRSVRHGSPGASGGCARQGPAARACGLV